VSAVTDGATIVFLSHRDPFRAGVPLMSGLVVSLLLIGGFLLVALTVRAIQRH